jgi:hypothetical protein
MRKIFVLSAIFVFLLSSCATTYDTNSHGLYGKSSKEKSGPTKVKHKKEHTSTGLYAY